MNQPSPAVPGDRHQAIRRRIDEFRRGVAVDPYDLWSDLCFLDTENQNLRHALADLGRQRAIAELEARKPEGGAS